MRKVIPFLLSAVLLFVMAAYQARVGAPLDMAGHRLAPDMIAVEALR
ncbi:MAG: hypothetical protein OQK05_06190 [Pseudopelagicola sp.]|nr:hypothetical protein [Pseudopelagicola sp.]